MTAVAVLSLGLALGGCFAVFRITDALLLRPLPVRNADRLYSVNILQRQKDGSSLSLEVVDYPLYAGIRDSIASIADVFAVSDTDFADVTYATLRETERVQVQHVSGQMFSSFGVVPSVGRVLSAADDEKLGAHPYVVLSHQYWQRRFGGDPGIVGKTLSLFRSYNTGTALYTIVGVIDERFTGTEPGKEADLYFPAAMHEAARTSIAPWARILLQLRQQESVSSVEERTNATLANLGRQDFVSASSHLRDASAGVSTTQNEYRLPLASLTWLLVVVLLMTCVNVANLMLARSGARSQELAVRVALGASRSQLVRMVFAETGIMVFFAASISIVFASWVGPQIVSLTRTAMDSARVSLGFDLSSLMARDWRTITFAVFLLAATVLLISLSPLRQVSAVGPVEQLKGGGNGRRNRYWLYASLAIQSAFCLLVLYSCGLFASTFQQLLNAPVGFSSDRLAVVRILADKPEPAVVWNDALARIRLIPSVQYAALAGNALLDKAFRPGTLARPGTNPPSTDSAWVMNISEDWLRAMKIPLLAGRDFRAGESYAGFVFDKRTEPNVALVNQALADRYFAGENPVGQFIDEVRRDGKRLRLEVIGLVGNAGYSHVRDPIWPTLYVPYHSTDPGGALQPRPAGYYLVRSRDLLDGSPSGGQSIAVRDVREELAKFHPELRVSWTRTQEDMLMSQMTRERLLALMGGFVGVVGVLIAGIGLYGVVRYSADQARREVAIRIALGASASQIARVTSLGPMVAIIVRCVLGGGMALALVGQVEVLFYRVSGTEIKSILVPLLIIGMVTGVALVPTFYRSLRANVAGTLRER